MTSNTTTKSISQEFYGKGKLLITGEYGVLDGALAFAVPTRLGQSMVVKKHRSSDIHWISYDNKGEKWFESKIAIIDFKPTSTTDEEISKNLTKLLKSAVRLNSEFLDKWNGFKVQTTLEFDRQWGLGSSSTLTHMVAEWAEVHPLSLHFKASHGSGFDVACAGANSPILYQINDDNIHYEPLDPFRPKFGDNLFFVYLNQKQSTNSSIDYYTKKVKGKKSLAKNLTDLTESLIECKTLSSFDKIIDEHETVLSKSLGIDPIKSLQFNDYWGSMKSLGAWGGDFILATSNRDKEETLKYFKEKGYETVLSLEEILI